LTNRNIRPVYIILKEDLSNQLVQEKSVPHIQMDIRKFIAAALFE
jgi:hypothetical protein